MDIIDTERDREAVRAFRAEEDRRHAAGEAPVAVVRPCPVCGATSVVTVSGEQYRRWAGGELIQSVFPDWTPAQRELLISGIDAGCWARVFGEEE